MKHAKLGSISHGTMKTEDLLSSFISCLEGLILINGDWLSKPEHFHTRDRLNNLIGEAQDAFEDDGETVKDDETASELVNDLSDALNEFAPAYSHFSSHEGDGSDYGFWVDDIDSIKEEIEFVSSKRQEYPEPDYEGEWLHISDHGNATLYSRTAGKDVELWSVV